MLQNMILAKHLHFEKKEDIAQPKTPAVRASGSKGDAPVDNTREYLQFEADWQTGMKQLEQKVDDCLSYMDKVHRRPQP